jgi:hypothetical protein
MLDRPPPPKPPPTKAKQAKAARDRRLPDGSTGRRARRQPRRLSRDRV